MVDAFVSTLPAPCLKLGCIVAEQPPLNPADLVGCRYRQVQKRRYPDIPPTPAHAHRHQRSEAARREVYSLIPYRRALGDPRRDFRRLDLEGTPEEREFATLEALAAGVDIITNAALSSDICDSALGKPLDLSPRWLTEVDVLLRISRTLQPLDAHATSWAYLPISISNHRVARPHPHTQSTIIPTARLGLGKTLQVHQKIRHHTSDSYRLYLAQEALQALGLGCGTVGMIGQDRSLAFLSDTPKVGRSVHAALTATLPTHPRRVRECADCRFWPICESELRARDDISLFLPGDKAQALLESGISTVEGLIQAGQGELSTLALAWRMGVRVLKRSTPQLPEDNALELDIDVEAYLDQGAYLWGTWDGHTYLPFATWEGLGRTPEARAFAAFWQWLNTQRSKAHAQGRRIRVYCWSNHGENHWLRFSARRFGGKIFDDGSYCPNLEEVEEFIASEEWVDLFAIARTHLAGPTGLGLKTVAPAAGFHWEEENFNGEDAVHAYRTAAASSSGESAQVRAQLLSYNADDCRATAAVRGWLRQGAPGIPSLGELSVDTNVHAL